MSHCELTRRTSVAHLHGSVVKQKVTLHATNSLPRTTSVMVVSRRAAEVVERSASRPAARKLCARCFLYANPAAQWQRDYKLMILICRCQHLNHLSLNCFRLRSAK